MGNSRSLLLLRNAERGAVNDLPPPSTRAVLGARVALDFATGLAGVALAFALSRHLTPALVALTIVVVIAVTAFIILLREFPR